MQKFSISIDLSKVDKLKLKKTEKGQIFVNFDIIVRDEIDQYGNIGFIVQKASKEEREQQVKLPILGNAKRIEIKQQAPATTQDYKSDIKNDLPF